MRCRGGQLGKIGDDIVPDLVLDGVDAGYLQAAHAFEEVALEGDELRQVLLVLDVGLHFDMVLGAPFAFQAEEVFAVEIGPNVVIVGKDAVGLVETDRGRGRRRGREEDDGGDGRQVGRRS